MTKSARHRFKHLLGNRLLLVAMGVVLLAGAGWTGYQLILRPGSPSQPPRVSYWVEDPKAETTVAAAIRASGATPATTSREKAQLVVLRAAVAGSTGVVPVTTGAPTGLASNQIVTPATQPAYYAVTNPQATNPPLLKHIIDRLAKTPAHLDPTWTMAVAGDIGFGRSIYTSMAARHDFLYPFQAFRSELRSADLALANLECALSDDHAVISTTGMTFVAPFRAAQGLKDSGFDAISVANNHSFNGGAAGYTDTLAELERLGISAIGGGHNEAEAHTPKILTVKGQRIALLAYSAIVGSQPAGASTPGMAYISMAPWGPLSEPDVARMEADIRIARTQADLVFVYYHWGAEYTHTANADQRTVAHRAIDAGADLILGAHPHWVQGVEWYNGHLIAYSLGNFIFDQDWSTETRQGTVLKVAFQGRTLQSAQFIPYEIVENLKPQPAPAAPAKQILGNVFAHSWWPPR